METETERRLATLDLSPELFVQFCLASQDGPPRRFLVIENGLPADVKVIDVTLVPLLGGSSSIIRLLLSSSKFEKVREEPAQLPAPVYKVVFDEGDLPWMKL